jgi:hypothetical protein
LKVDRRSDLEAVSKIDIGRNGEKPRVTKRPDRQARVINLKISWHTDYLDAENERKHVATALITLCQIGRLSLKVSARAWLSTVSSREKLKIQS